MASFFITNDAKALEQARPVFASKPVRIAPVRSVNGVDVLHASKRIAQVEPALHEDEQGWLLGVGTFYFRGRFGRDCLPELWTELQREWSVIGEVSGHFAFVIYLGNTLHVATDKTGIYQVLRASNGDHFYISTSLLAIAECLPQLTLCRQEVLEYINTETSFGQRTAFSEIQHLDPGVVAECTVKGAQLRYYEPRDHRVSFDELVERCTSYFSSFKSVDTCADLSGGRDSRTVAALLLHAGVTPAFNTNRNQTDPNDHKVAVQVGEYLGRPVDVFENRLAEYEYGQLVQQCFETLELARNIYGGAFSTIYFTEKAERYPLVLGGYGGELLRDVYSKSTSFGELIRRKYVFPKASYPKAILREYEARLLEKFTATADRLGESDIKKGVEKIYFFEKMRFWGGSRITAFNQYTHRVHPLLDHTLAKHYFDFSLQEKANCELQQRLTGLVSGLANIPYTGELAQSRRPIPLVQWTRRQAFIPKLTDLPPDVLRYFRYRRARRRFKPSPKIAVAEKTIQPALLSMLGIETRCIPDAGPLGRLASIAYALARFESKIRGV